MTWLDPQYTEDRGIIAKQDRFVFGSLFGAGVIQANDLALGTSGSLSYTIASGQIIVSEVPPLGAYFCYNDASIVVADITSNASAFSRLDCVVVQVDDNEKGATGGSQVLVRTIPGTPAPTVDFNSRQGAPALASNQYLLYDMIIKPGATATNNPAQITFQDRRVLAYIGSGTAKLTPGGISTVQALHNNVAVGTEHILDFVDDANGTIVFNLADVTASSKITVTAQALIPIQQDGTLVGKRTTINFVNSGNVKFNASDAPSSDRVNVSASITIPTPTMDIRSNGVSGAGSASILDFIDSSSSDITWAVTNGSGGTRGIITPTLGTNIARVSQLPDVNGMIASYLSSNNYVTTSLTNTLARITPSGYRIQTGSTIIGPSQAFPYNVPMDGAHKQWWLPLTPVNTSGVISIIGTLFSDGGGQLSIDPAFAVQAFGNFVSPNTASVIFNNTLNPGYAIVSWIIIDAG